MTDQTINAINGLTAAIIAQTEAMEKLAHTNCILADAMMCSEDGQDIPMDTTDLAGNAIARPTDLAGNPI